VILINLLPHREAARKRRKEQFFVLLGAAALLGGMVCGLVYGWYQAQISTQNDKNVFLEAETKKLDNEIKEVATLQAEIAALRARQGAVESLQGDRNLPVFVLTDLVKQLPDGVFVASMRQEGNTLSLTGSAQTQERVAEFLRNLNNNSVWFSKPDLIEVVAGNISLGAKDTRRVASFSIKTQVRKPTDVQKPAAGASAPAASASAPKTGA
jgi:type IV pilus assembly protein PilN